ncbi:MAG: hypothetical protein JXA99_03435 [Candidatus Lokiarchaeota archaeon]|nr:hypothetical protein [Candidatus Lokiarchaeota archaeon]
MEAAVKNGIIKKGFMNLDYFYNTYKSIFNLPFVLCYKLTDNKKVKPEFRIELENKKEFYQITCEYSNNRCIDPFDTDIVPSDFMIFINPILEKEKSLKVYIPSILNSLQISLRIFGEKEILIMPIFRHSTSEDSIINKINIGATTVVLNETISDELINFYLWIIQSIINLSNLGHLTDYISFQKSILKKSINSAIAAIMSRNGSHNIGSHILSAVSNSYNELPDDQILFEYIQQRMDYVATISTEFPEWTYPVWFVGDLMRRFYMQRHLLNYIGQSEGLSAYEFQIKPEHTENLSNKNQREKIFIKIKRKGAQEYIIPNNIRNISDLEDFQVAIPGGIIGQQAFYTVLENIIRNSAKHNWSNLNDSEKGKIENLDITVEIDENTKRDCIVFRIWDNASDIFKGIDGLSATDKKYLASQSLPDAIQVEQKKIEELPLHQQINKKLSESFIDRESGKLIRKNWGLAEIKISVGFLNMKNVDQIGSDDVDEIIYNSKKRTGFIQAVAQKDNKEVHEDIYHLGYEFAIKKPKEFLIVDYNIPEDIEKYQENSIAFCREDDLKSYDYEFVIIYYNGNDENDFLTELIKNVDNLNGEIEKYPFRLFLVTRRTNIFGKSEFLQKRICFLEPDRFIEEIKEPGQFKIWIYTQWIKHLKTITGNDTKSINMLINVRCDRNHSQDESLVKLLFNNYQQLIVKTSLKHVKDETILNALKLVKVAEFDEKIAPFEDVETLIHDWKNIAKNYLVKEIDHNYMKDIESCLLEKAKDYYYLLENIYKKYEENIETLPKEYMAKQDKNQNEFKWKANELATKKHTTSNWKINDAATNELKINVIKLRI